ncbi:MAG: hypothetical protein AB2693_08865 [Candidatus Thiodiazotropha sp.]
MAKIYRPGIYSRSMVLQQTQTRKLQWRGGFRLRARYPKGTCALGWVTACA